MERCPRDEDGSHAEAPERDTEQREYQPNDKRATDSAAKGPAQFPVSFASRAIFRNATILLNPSIAKERLKSQRSNTPSMASCGWSPFIKLVNGGNIPLKTAMKRAGIGAPIGTTPRRVGAE